MPIIIALAYLRGQTIVCMFYSGKMHTMSISIQEGSLERCMSFSIETLLCEQLNQKRISAYARANGIKAVMSTVNFTVGSIIQQICILCAPGDWELVAQLSSSYYIYVVKP